MVGHLRVLAGFVLLSGLGMACAPPPSTLNPQWETVEGYIAVEVYDDGALVEERGGPATFAVGPTQTTAPGGAFGDGIYISTMEFTTGPGFAGEQGTYSLVQQLDIEWIPVSPVPNSYYYGSLTLSAPDQSIELDGFEGQVPGPGFGAFGTGLVADPGCDSGQAREWLVSAPTVADPSITVDFYWGYCYEPA